MADIFKKAILIIGDPNTGKTKLSLEIVFGKKHITINGRQKISVNNFTFSECDLDTEYVIIDDYDFKLNNIEDLFYCITDGFQLNKQCHNPRYINPIFIINANSSRHLTTLTKRISVKNRFNIYQLANKK